MTRTFVFQRTYLHVTPTPTGWLVVYSAQTGLGGEGGIALTSQFVPDQFLQRKLEDFVPHYFTELK